MELTPFEKLDEAAMDKMILISAMAAAQALAETEQGCSYPSDTEELANEVIVKLATTLEERFGISA